MDARRKRQVIIGSIAAFSLVVVAAVGTAAFFVIRNQQRSDDVAEASRVAAAFHKEVSAYRSSVQAALTDDNADNPKQLKAAFEEAVAKPPELGDAPEWGATHSKAYLKAKKAEKTLTEPYEDVSAVLDEAVVGQPFIKAAKDALDFKIDDFVGTGSTFYNGSPFRDKLVPGIEKILATFDKVKVPKGRESVARSVREALKGVIKDAKKAAAELDAGRNTSINAQSEYVKASSAVFTYERSLRSRLEAAIRKATSEASGQSSEASEA